MAFGSFNNSGGGQTQSEINMVPLIDVMLVLLVIFMVTAPLLTHSIQINVPQASSEPVTQKPDIIDLAVDGQGQVFWNEEPVTLDALPELLAQQAVLDPQPNLHIRADLETRYDVLAQIMAGAKQAGMQKVGFITRPGEKALESANASSGN
ncbi:MAG TPA: biopolymer transporter ExbD [Pusillimonas sp.]|jgi:biopolymer transport protein ExbD|nr:biopolymer transporter ExbD [Pusillimonas sp.]MBC41908.1 biopolymer transporter ExbD [Pusillimonas sp.]HBT33122.1 biopolymer transporter ExbD [Pusillimonas sp.]HCP79211.1 biopolymer transporter ExbD [Pusillimonas sp.]|tara:strand:+ start:16141 stop:16593 length:453 start_codon:yes stop_codon:yes gene_type:complete